VTVYSEVGIGTTFRLYLPPAQLEGQAPPEPDAPGLEAPSTTRQTVVVVDDNDAMRDVAALQLQTLGYHVIVAETAAHALEVLRGEQIVDLLLTDIVMPGQLDGRQLALQARALRPDLKVLFTSGFTETTLAASIQADFAGSVLSKPYRQVDLANRLHHIFEERERAQS
jgi:CheY-like chemotaxis protein